MSIKKINITRLNEWVDDLINKQKVIGVQAKSDKFVFNQLAKAANLRLDYDVTIIPPKAFLQPPKEPILSFKNGVGYESILDSEPFVLFGVHPYDLIAIQQMDEIFTQGNYDVHYMTKRENATIVVVDIQKASKDAFAGYMGTSYVEDGYDVLLTRIGDEFIVDTKTAKGEDLITSIADAPDVSESWIEQRSLVWGHNKQLLRKHELRAEPSTWPPRA